MSLILVEGNISSGKTTLCKQLCDKINADGYSNARVFTEPVEENPFLAKFYQNPKKYATKMQIWLLRSRFQTYLKALKHIHTGEHPLETSSQMALPSDFSTPIKNLSADFSTPIKNSPTASAVNGIKSPKSPKQPANVAILDRSIFSDLVFALKCHEDQLMSDSELGYYCRLREKMIAPLPLPQVILYLDVEAKVCYDRIHNLRKRECESSIQLDYLEGIEKYYKLIFNEEGFGKFHNNLEGKSKPVILSLNWNDFGDMNDVSKQLMETVKMRPFTMTVALEGDMEKLFQNELKLMTISSPSMTEKMERIFAKHNFKSDV